MERENKRYRITKANRVYRAVRAIVEYEVKPGNGVSFFNQVDLSAVEAIRKRLKAAGLTAPSYTAFVIKAVAISLKSFPHANARLIDHSFSLFGRNRIQQFEHCDIAVQAEMQMPDTEVATFADILRDADQASFEDIQHWLRALGNAEQSGNPQWRQFRDLMSRWPSFLSRWLIRLPLFSPALWARYRGGAVLVNSPARYGVDMLAATWTWPITVSFGLVKARPMVVEGKVVARPSFTLIMNFDRRVMAGAQAARFFKHLSDVLEQADATMGEFLPEGWAESEVGETER